LGGTCLNWGCIPSKALLDASHKYVDAKNLLPSMGIKTGKLELDVGAMMAHKNAVVAKLTGGVAGLFKGNGVEWLAGTGKLLAGRKVEFQPPSGESQTFAAQHVILAPGSRPAARQPHAPRGQHRRRLDRSARVRRRAEAPRGHRRRCDRSRARQRLESARLRSHRSRSARGFPADGRFPHCARCEEDLR